MLGTLPKTLAYSFLSAFAGRARSVSGESAWWVSVCTMALIALALLGATPARAVNRVINCPRSVTDSYATMVFDISRLDIADSEAEIDRELELRFDVQVEIRQAGTGGTGALLCRGNVNWSQTVPVLNISYGGMMRYDLGALAHRVEVANVPRNSVVMLRLSVWEDDALDMDFADLSPVPGDGAMELTLYPSEGTGQTQLASAPGQRDIAFGQRKRVQGDGWSGTLSDFRAAVEFTVAMSAAVPATRDTGLTGPGQALTSREDSCRAYALSAVQQNALQMQLHCNYAPPVWNSDPNAHFNWCMEAGNVALTEAGRLMREAGLAACRAQNP